MLLITSVQTNFSKLNFFQGESFRLTVDSLHEELKDMNPDITCNESASGDLTSGKRRSHQIPTSKVNGSSSGTQCSARIQEEILRSLRYIVQRQEQEDHRIRVVNEWRQIALVIDRILFWIFFIVTVMSSLSFLVIVPLHRRGLQFTQEMGMRITWSYKLSLLRSY